MTGKDGNEIRNLGTRVVDNYLISSEAGLILIDTGYEGGFPHFMKMLEKNHIEPKEIRYLFLTHAHDDHAGFLNEVLETPGHTADHISLMTGDRVFCGDAAMNGFPSRRRTTIWIENLQQYRQSWETILAKNPDMLYPAHGKPFRATDLKKYLKSLDKGKLYALKSK